MANKNFIVKNGITLEGYGQVVDSAGNWTGVEIGGGTDSAQVVSIINGTVDATYINALTIDADTLGSQAGSYYLDYNNFTNTPNILDSASVIGIVDSDYINSRVTPAGAINDIFYENSITISQDYTISSGKNAMSTGPLSVDSGVSVTIPSGSVWTVI